jgi:hypothetical protein
MHEAESFRIPDSFKVIPKVTPILGAPIGTLSCRFRPFYMIDMFVPSADARA